MEELNFYKNPTRIEAIESIGTTNRDMLESQIAIIEHTLNIDFIESKNDIFLVQGIKSTRDETIKYLISYSQLAKENLAGRDVV